MPGKEDPGMVSQEQPGGTGAMNVEPSVNWFDRGVCLCGCQGHMLLAEGAGEERYVLTTDRYVYEPAYVMNEEEHFRCQPFVLGRDPPAGWRCVYVNDCGSALWCQEGMVIGTASRRFFQDLNWKTQGGLMAGILVRANRDRESSEGYWRRAGNELRCSDNRFSRKPCAEQYRDQLERFERRSIMLSPANPLAHVTVSGSQ